MLSPKTLTGSALLFGAVVTGGFFLAGSVSADTNRPDSLIDRIAARFNLNRSDIEGVMNEERAAHQAERQKEFESRLSDAVQRGAITEEQKKLIEEKHAALKNEREASRDAWRNMSKEERRAEHKKRHEEMASWMKANNIPDGIMALGMKGSGYKRGGMGCGRAQE